MSIKINFKFTREWFLDKKNQVHTIQDNKLFGRTDECETIQIGEHFLVDLIPVFDNGENRSSTDIEIWEVENTEKKHSVPHRGKLSLKPIRKITTGKQFGYPNGYWKVPEELSSFSHNNKNNHAQPEDTKHTPLQEGRSESKNRLANTNKTSGRDYSHKNKIKKVSK